MTDREPRPSITCPECRRTSWNPEDVREGYCGNCHWWTSDPRLAPHRPSLEFDSSPVIGSGTTKTYGVSSMTIGGVDVTPYVSSVTLPMPSAPPADMTPGHLARITPWSVEDWQMAYTVLGWREDWPQLAKSAIGNHWHPAMLVAFCKAIVWVDSALSRFGVLRQHIPDRVLFPHRSAMHQAYRHRQIARARRRRRKR